MPPSQRPQVWKRGRLKKTVKNRKVNERTDKENNKGLIKEVNPQRRGRLSEKEFANRVKTRYTREADTCKRSKAMVKAKREGGGEGEL